ncbi:ribonuclease T2 isoform X1 [Bubalus bubalis]|uniref:ribonuclease T2 isoform X1 n=1 Tax=Bubalus bubalis TaxID=89462 RepID=UPI001E1B669C|nr:ribonuclease T2 isoform X1 [Bubalus bubalis]
MNSPAFLGALCLALSCLGGAHGLWRSDDLEWSKLIMVHHWPATVCQTSHTEERLPRQKGSKQEGLREVASHCKDPPNYWTIHGLWPDKSEACNRSWPFNPKEIQDLLPDMKMYWPDLLHPSNCSLRFWSHEWKKHGTCAAQLDALNSQRKYFGKSLDLYKALALTSMLQKLGIEPSTDHYYQVSDIRDALVTVYKVVPKVQCFLLEKKAMRQGRGPWAYRAASTSLVSSAVVFCRTSR